MEYKKYGEAIYARFDKGDEVVNGILNICKKENILSATYSGIGGCDDITVSTLIPEKHEFLPHNKSGILLEMISLNGNISADDNNELFHHTHAMFSYLENNELKFIGGHLIKAVISYTGEIVINPVQNGIIRRKFDDKTGIVVWNIK
jgi:predicted DNA-binding protein with PD1-like motif